MPHANHSHGPHIRIRRVLGEGPLAGETIRQAKSERPLYRVPNKRLAIAACGPPGRHRMVNAFFQSVWRKRGGRSFVRLFESYACICDSAATHRMTFAHVLHAAPHLLLCAHRRMLVSTTRRRVETPWIGPFNWSPKRPWLTPRPPLPRATLAYATKAPAAKRNFFLRLADAIERANMRRADREIERFLDAHGHKFTDESEREIERRFLGGR